MMPQDDSKMEMIKAALSKIIDEMDSFEADRIMPMDKKPKVMAAKIDVMSPDHDDSMMDGKQEPDDDDQLDPEVLKELMSKAGEADDDGSLPEDATDSLDPSIADLVKKKKASL